MQKERAQEAAAANAARTKAAAEAADQRTKMKGKNKPTRRNRKKQQNIIDEKKPAIKQRIAEEVCIAMLLFWTWPVHVLVIMCMWQQQVGHISV